MKTKDYKYWEKKISQKINQLWQKSNKFLPCHGPSHHWRVWKNAEKFGKKKGADLEILVASCLLHDLAAFNKSPINGHNLQSAKIAKSVLESINFPKEKIKVVCGIISTHRSGKKQAGGLEGDIMKAFDKVDTLGPMGVYRIITPMSIRGYDLTTIVKWFLTDGKVKRKWQAIKFPEIKRQYRSDYLYTLNFFKKLAKFK
ncbi:MAG: HD domain-containing protein [Patescibacteria group bacterium]|jgi:HD superfamily phosphodiesterase